MSDKVIKIGVVGLGTVGASVVRLLQGHADLLSARSGAVIEIAGVHARRKDADRGVDLSAYQWFDDPRDMVGAVDVLVELIGGSDGIALELTRAALAKGVHVVTANKAMLAHHGAALSQLAEENDALLYYEAAVAGTIPAVAAARQNLAANEFSGVYGILNGTCNFILTQMRQTGRAFADVLKEAQEAGYAEADPTFDIEGVDAGHKIALLAASAFGVQPNFDAVHLKGISALAAEDFTAAESFDYKIKLIASATRHDGAILQAVEPCLVPLSSPFAAIEDAYNGVMFACDYADTPLLTGLGAGGDATASAVVGDLIAIARGEAVPVFGVASTDLQDHVAYDYDQVSQGFYLRLAVDDRPGVLADISAILRDHDVSVDAMNQHAGQDQAQELAILVMTTHKALRKDMMAALAAIEALDTVHGDVCVLKIEDQI